MRKECKKADKRWDYNRSVDLNMLHTQGKEVDLVFSCDKCGGEEYEEDSFFSKCTKCGAYLSWRSKENTEEIK